MAERGVAPALLAALLVAGWVASFPVPARAQRPDKLTDFAVEFLGALGAIFRMSPEAAEELCGRFDDVARLVLERFGGVEGVRQYVANLFKGYVKDPEKLANKVVDDLLQNPGRKFDYKFFRGPYVVHVEVKPSTANLHHAVKEMLQDIALAGSVQRLRTKPGESPLIVWFIDPSIAGKPEVKPLIDALKKNGVVVITDSESLRVLKTLDSNYRSRYGMDLIGSVADWYGIKDPEARAAFKQAVESGDIYGELAPLPDRIVTLRSEWY